MGCFVLARFLSRLSSGLSAEVFFAITCDEIKLCVIPPLSVATDVLKTKLMTTIVLFVMFVCLCLFVLFLFISVCYRQGE